MLPRFINNRPCRAIPKLSKSAGYKDFTKMGNRASFALNWDTPMAGMIPPEVVEQVRNACDIVDVIGGYVPLKRAGAKFKALSPFNKEKTPSFFVDPAKQIFKCFSSGNGGDVFKFLMLMENMTFPEAVRRLAQRAGVAIPESGPFDPQARSRREELLALHAAVAAWWAKLLHSDPAAEPARAYLKSRELDSALAQEFGLGYAPEGWDTTMNWARKAGYSLEALETARLVATGSESGKRFDFFRGRLMIPIHDEAGQVVAFSGRLLDPEAKAQKYVNSTETPIFSKSKILFGLNRTKRPIIEAGSAILCEGQIDLMRCWQKGVRNVVAPQGTAFTEQQARTLKRLAKEVVICFDADNAGQKAAQRVIEVLLKEDVQIRIARIPEGEDPDSLLRRQPVAVFENIIREAKDYTRHLLDVACAEEDPASPRGRGVIAQHMAQVIAKIPNAVQREAFLLEVARRLQAGRSVIEEEVRKAEAQMRHNKRVAELSPSAQAAEGEGDSGAVPETPAEPIEADKTIEALLALLLTQPELVPEVSRQLDPAWTEGLGGAEVLRQLLEVHADDAWENANLFQDECDERTKNFLSGLLFSPPPMPPATDAAAYAGLLVARLETRWQRQRMQVLEQDVKSGLFSGADLARKMTELTELWKALRRKPGEA
jgi:DNA primase